MSGQVKELDLARQGMQNFCVKRWDAKTEYTIILDAANNHHVFFFLFNALSLCFSLFLLYYITHTYLPHLFLLLTFWPLTRQREEFPASTGNSGEGRCYVTRFGRGGGESQGRQGVPESCEMTQLLREDFVRQPRNPVRD